MTSNDIASLAPQTDAVSGAKILVGEMIEWSDLQGVRAPVAVREVVTALLGEGLGDSQREGQGPQVLLVGARAGLLVTALPTNARVDLLVRSVPDARTLGDLAGLHPSARLYCGGLDAFAPERTYELVVSLGGPSVLLSPDSRGMGEAEVIDKLAACVDDGGRLVLDLANAWGLDDLVVAAPLVDPLSNAAWSDGAAGFDTRPLYARERGSVLERSGLRVTATYAALPAHPDHRLLVRVDKPLEGALRDEAVRRVGESLESSTATSPLLRDPRPAAARVVEAGLLDELAPAWVLVTGKGLGTGSVDATPELPALVDAGADGDAPWEVVTTVDSLGVISTAWADGRADGQEFSRGSVSRTLTTPGPQGRSLEGDLRVASARRRHADVRALVRRYREWLGDESHWTGPMAPRSWFAVPSNVVVLDDDSLALADASWSRQQADYRDDHFVRGLRQFARRLLSSGAAHPWPATTTPDELTTTLAAMAGVAVTAADLERLARVEAEVQALVLDRPGDVYRLIDENVDDGRYARHVPAADAIGYRELLAHDRAQARMLREKQGQVAWLEGTLRHRDRYIRRLEKTIESFEETVTYRLVHALRAPRRVATEKAVSAAMSAAEEALPPETISRARKVVARVLR